MPTVQPKWRILVQRENGRYLKEKSAHSGYAAKQIARSLGIIYENTGFRVTVVAPKVK